MKDSYTVNIGAVYVEIASISAALRVSFEVQVKDLPKAEREYWRNHRRKEELRILLNILSADPSQPESHAAYLKMEQELGEIEAKIAQYNSEHLNKE